MSFDISNPSVDSFSVMNYIENINYDDDSTALTLINELFLTERNGN